MAVIHPVRGRRVAAGLASWLVPFLAATPVYGSDGRLLVKRTAL